MAIRIGNGVLILKTDISVVVYLHANATMRLKRTQISQLHVTINKISEKAKQERQKASTHNKQVTQNKPYITHLISSA